MTYLPRVSVLMAVYNGATFLREAVDSILSQNFSDFEFVIVDDGSVDGSIAILKSYVDDRIRLIEASHSGLTAALNRGLAECRGELIARMDADDIAFPDRLQTQIDYLDSHREVDLLCSNAVLINEEGHRIGEHHMGQLDRETLRAAFRYKIPFKPIIHPSVTMRRAVTDTLGGYRDFACAEDFDFWKRASESFVFAAIDRPLLAYRMHSGGVSRERRAQQATSGVMCVTTHEVRNVTGIDIFERHRDLFDRLAAETKKELQRETLPAEAKYRAARKVMREKGPLIGAFALGAAILRNGPSVLPWLSRKRTLVLIEELIMQIRVELEEDRGADT